MTLSATDPQGRDITQVSTSTAAPPAANRPASTLRAWLLLVAGIIGAVTGALLADRYFGVIPRQEMSEKAQTESRERWASQDFSPDVLAEMKLKNEIQLGRNSALALGLIGAILGGLFGLATGIAAKGWGTVAAGAIGGTLSGAAFGAAAGYLGTEVSVLLQRFQLEAVTPDELARAWLRQMYLSIAVHATIWCLVGVGVALAVGLASRAPRAIGRKIGFGCLAGLIAGVAYMPLASLLFPSSKSGGPFPESLLNRLMYVILPSLAMALLLSEIGGRRAASTSSPDAPAGG